MNTKTLPSNLKSLSLAISQVIVLSGGIASVANATSCITVNPSNPLTISSNTSGYVCQDSSGPVSVTLNSGVTLNASGYEAGIYAEGTIALGDNAQIILEDNDRQYTAGIEIGNGNGDQLITLGSGAAIETSSDSNNQYTNVDGIDVFTQNGNATVTLGNNSKVSATSTAEYRSDATAISLGSKYSGSGSSPALVEINGNGTSISATAMTSITNSSTWTEAEATAIAAHSTGKYTTAQTTIDLSNSDVTASSQNYSESASAYAIEASAFSYEGNANTTISLNSTEVTATAASATSDATAKAIYAESESDGYSNNDTSSISLTLNNSDVIASANGNYAEAMGVYAEGEAYYGDSTISIDLTDSSIETTATGEEYADSTGIYSVSESEYGNSTNTISLNDSAIKTSASAYEASTVGIFAEASSEYGDSTTSINLSNSSVDSSATGEKYAESAGLIANSNSYYGNATSSVTLNNSAIKVDATSYGAAIGLGMVVSSYSDNGDMPTSIEIDNSSLEVNSSTSQTDGFALAAGAMLSGNNTVSLNDSSITTHASGYYAISMAATGKYSEEDIPSTIEINRSSISATAEGIVVANAGGIGVQGEDASLTLNDTSVDISAEISDNNGIAIANGLSANADNTAAITLNNSNVNVTASGGNYAEGGKYTAAVQISGGSSDTASTVTLNNSNITVTSDNAYDFGIYDASQGSAGTIISLDANSSISAKIAVASQNTNSSLNNAGNLFGDVYMYAADNSGNITGNIDSYTFDNSGNVTGDVSAYEFNNSGDVTGLVSAYSIDNSGNMFGLIGGNTINNSGTINGLVGGNILNVNNGGVVAGTADVSTLNVASGGELQAVFDDTTEQDVAHFTAVNATLEDGAKIHINATSELFSVDLEGADYLILQADNSLEANEENLVLRASGLVGVQWAECDDLSLCVNVRALNLAELAEEAGAATNSVKAASAAQSVLTELAGTEKGDAFMELFSRIADSKDWDGAEGSSALGSGLAASNASERVATRYIQRIMKAGRSSGEEFQGERGLWIQALQVDGDGDSNSGVVGFDVDTTGLAIGYSADLKPGLLIGGAFSYANSNVDSDDNVSKAESDNYMATIYSQWTQGEWFANAMFTYGQGDNDGTRTLAGDRIKADYDSDMLSVRFQGGRSFTAESGLTLSPRVELNYNHTDVDSYDEKGSIAALSVDSQSYETIELGIGAELSKAYIVDRSVITPYVDVVVYQDLSQDQVQTNSRFILGGDNFVTEGSDVAKTNVSATMGVDYAISSASSLRASYEYFGNSNYKSSAWMLRYSYSF